MATETHYKYRLTTTVKERTEDTNAQGEIIDVTDTTAIDEETVTEEDAREHTEYSSTTEQVEDGKNWDPPPDELKLYDFTIWRLQSRETGDYREEDPSGITDTSTNIQQGTYKGMQHKATTTTDRYRFIETVEVEV